MYNLIKENNKKMGGLRKRKKKKKAQLNRANQIFTLTLTQSNEALAISAGAFSYYITKRKGGGVYRMD